VVARFDDFVNVILKATVKLALTPMRNAKARYKIIKVKAKPEPNIKAPELMVWAGGV
jgi:hypothetical protein